MKKPSSARVIPIQALAADASSDDLFSAYEKQDKIYARAVGGWFARWRWVMVWVTQIVFYGLPWLQWNGRQAVLFDLSERRFFVLGLVLHPQDLIYLAALLILAALLLFFVTAVAGRLWCGYACPQTVYTEMFMWLERRTEGDRLARMRLDAAPWGAEKLARKAAKQASWIGLSLVTGLSFVGYFTPMQTLAAELMQLSFSPWEWFWVLFYGAATYGNAGFLREQFCKFMCPYARIQSALTDMDTVVIAYDAARGENRGSRPRSADPKALGLGDCIDCTLCVQVCPTGIDIRNGLQNECIACAACIDVCDDVMKKMGYPLGLIRYSSGNAMAENLSSKKMLTRLWRPRVLIYALLLSLVSTAFVLSLSLRKGFSVDVIKDRATLARELGNGAIENVYRLQIMNGTEHDQKYSVSVSGLPELQMLTPAEISVAPTGIGSLPLRLVLPAQQAQDYRGLASPITLKVSSTVAGKVQMLEEKSTFIVPR